MTPAPTTAAQIAVGVCTYRRPEVLAVLLDRLHTVAAASSDEVSVVVVDDDPEASAGEVVRDFADRFTGDVLYVAHGGQNISGARNRVLRESQAYADFVALTDDDCVPHREWLSTLMDVQRSYDADIVSGHCVDLAPAGAPDWFRSEGWVDQFDQPDHGSEIEVGWIKNTLLRLSTVERLELEFEDEFGRTGGEDVMFFYRAADRGVNHRFAAGAIVEETVPLSRVNVPYQLLRALWYGNSAANTSIAAGRAGRLRMLAQGVRAVAEASAVLGRRAVRREPLRLRFQCAMTLIGMGKMLRVVGVRIRHSTVNRTVALFASRRSPTQLTGNP